MNISCFLAATIPLARFLRICAFVSVLLNSLMMFSPTFLVIFNCFRYRNKSSRIAALCRFVCWAIYLSASFLRAFTLSIFLFIWLNNNNCSLIGTPILDIYSWSSCLFFIFCVIFLVSMNVLAFILIVFTLTFVLNFWRNWFFSLVARPNLLRYTESATLSLPLFSLIFIWTLALANFLPSLRDTFLFKIFNLLLVLRPNWFIYFSNSFLFWVFLFLVCFSWNFISANFLFSLIEIFWFIIPYFVFVFKPKLLM